MPAEPLPLDSASAASGPLPRVLWLGETARPEFADARLRLGEQATVEFVNDVAAALDWLAGPPANRASLGWIVLATPRPGIWSAAELAQLRAAAPHARLVALLGPWCEGELAKQSPPAGVQRVLWHHFAARFAAWTRRGTRAGPAAWPLSSSDEERLARSLLQRDAAWRPQRCQLAVPHYETRDALAAALIALGCRLQRAAGDSPPDLRVWLAPRELTAALAACRNWQAAGDACPNLALVDALRPHERALLLEAGATTVLHRPFTLLELAAAIEACR